MEHVYPPGPDAVPANLTAATAAYKRHAWLAMLGLAGFIALYLSLSAWFALTAWRLISGVFNSNDFELLQLIAGVSAAFLAVFMLKALFFIQHRYEVEDIEITRADQPRLFEFIDRLADEARAPRAHKVYLSPRVNAAVFYDLSLLNLIIPAKKNLEIGLGLVNVLSLGELKAVLAHEFGHFAQRSMAVGRWVYIAQQIAGHVVARRDALDRMLQALSRFDLRVAWIGWVLSIVVWSIRSMMDVLFRAVLIAQRALSRQMEFQADLVAVSLTGSDALIHALHRLNAADDAWDKTLAFANDEANHKRGVGDLFAVHAKIIERMREILNQPTYGVVPPVPRESPDAHRVFKTALAQPPRMWLTHPPSAERELNAKRHYIAAAVDERSAWALFDDAQAVREKMSAHVFRKAETEPVPMDKTLDQLGKEYGRAFLDRRYRGVYLGRSPVRHVAKAGELYATSLAGDVPAALEALYPESLADEVEALTEMLEEKTSLEALRDQVAQAPGGIIRHNGRELRRAELPEAIAQLAARIGAARVVLETHDRDCRTAHLFGARLLDKGWPAYLQGLATTLHYADHTLANLQDAQGYVANIYRVVTADGRISSDELSRMIAGCQELYRPLAAIYSDAGSIVLDRTLLRRLDVESWQAMLEEFKLPGPSRDNIGKWLEVIDGWVNASSHALSKLRVAALEQLLLAEQQVSKFVRDGMVAADAPPAASLPAQYATLLPGQERQRQKRLDLWDRFHAAEGVLPMLARSAVAVGIVGGVVVLGGHLGTARVTIFNSLALPVTVDVGGERISAPPGQPVTLEVDPSRTLSIRSSTAGDELIESFDEKIDGANKHYVYNVAGATPLVEWTAVYTEGGTTPPTGEHQLGPERWLTTVADHVFEEPPQSIKIDNGGAGYRRVLSALYDVRPSQQVSMITDPKEVGRLALAHARWDSTDSADFLEWLALASRESTFDSLLQARLAKDAGNIPLRRYQQDTTEGEAHAAVCAEQVRASDAAPENPDLLYLSIRCADDDHARQNARFVAAHEKWPQHAWLRFASGISQAERGNYGDALTLLENTRLHLAPVRGYVTLEIARLRRLTSQSDPSLADLVDGKSGSRELATFLAIEDGAQTAGTPLAPYASLARGELADTLEKSAQAGDGRPRLLRLVASSEGATAAMISEALAAPLESDADLESAFAMYGLAAREHRDVAPYAEVVAKRLGERRSVPILRFLDRLRSGGDPESARAGLGFIDLGTRLQAFNAAIVMLGDRAPESWRSEVRRGLFVGERPYLSRPKVAQPGST